MGNTRDTGYLRNLVTYDASGNITLPANLTVTGVITGYATTSYVTTQINNLINGAPGLLDTLDELAAALGDDANFASTITTSIAGRQAALSGTGFVKISGTTISYDNSTYLTTSSAISTYLPLSGGTLTGPLIGTSASFSTVSTDYVMTLSNINDSSQGLLVRATDNDSSLFLLKLQSSNGATSQTWVDRFTVAKNGETTISSTAYNVTNFNSSYGQANINIQNGGVTFAVFGSGASVTSTAGPNDVGIGTGGLNNAIVFGTGTGYIERVRITNGGYLGIGSNNPARILHTVGVSGGAEWVLEDTGSSINQKKFNVIVAGNKTQFRVLNDANNGGTIWLTTDNSNGFVGIGSIAPTRRLTVQGADDGVLQIRMQGTADTTSYCEIGREAYSTGDFRINVARSGTVINALRISDTTGNATFSNSITAGGNLNIANTLAYGRAIISTSETKSNSTLTGNSAALFLSTNETSQPFGVKFFVLGNTVNANRYVMLQTGEHNYANDGNLIFQPSGGNVGVGNSNPGAKLTVQSTGATGILLEQDGSNPSVSSRLVARYNAGTGTIRYDTGGWRINTGATLDATSGTERALFSQDGYFRMLSGTGGVQFQGTTGAANALNYYEEGTWTPSILGSTGESTYPSNRLGWYTRVGRLVTITWFVSITKNNMTGTLRMSGFPFTLLSGGAFYPQGTVLLDSLAVATNNITLQGANNSTSGDFIGGNGSTSTHTGLPVSVLGSGTMECRGTLTYFTA